MKRAIVISSILVVGIFSYAVYRYCSSQNPKAEVANASIELKQSNVIEHKEKRDTISSNWKIYSNDKLGVTFEYPSSWIKNGNEVEVVNRQGSITSIEVNFSDSTSQTILSVAYYFAPNGIELFRYAVSEYESSLGRYANNGKQRTIAGCKAIESFAAITEDGKGNILSLPIRLIIVDFLDKNNEGEIQLQFKTPLEKEEIEVAKFEHLLSSFSFSN